MTAFLPNQSDPARPGKTCNSASIVLTDAEKTITYEKDGKKYTVPLEDGVDISANRTAILNNKPSTINHIPKTRKKRAIPASPGVPRVKNLVHIRLSLEELAVNN